MSKPDNQLGLIYVFTGDGKGKTSAGLGVAIRALAAGLNVAIIQWYKDPAWRISEHNISKLLLPEALNRFAIYPMGVGFYIENSQAVRQSGSQKIDSTPVKETPSLPDSQTPRLIKTAPLSNGQVVIDKATETDHKTAAQAALSKAYELLNLKISDPATQLPSYPATPDLLILDEINNAIEDGLLTADEVIRLICERGKTHLILTGRNVHKDIVEIADLVTDMTKIKHPYDQGKLAVKGLDF